MATVNCPYCGKTGISSNLVNCPACGKTINWSAQRKIEAQAQFQAVLIVQVIHLVFMLLSWAIVSGGSGFGFLLAIITSLVGIGALRSDYVGGEAWTIYGIVMFVAILTNGAPIGMIMMTIIAAFLRYGAGNKKSLL